MKISIGEFVPYLILSGVFLFFLFVFTRFSKKGTGLLIDESENLKSVKIEKIRRRVLEIFMVMGIFIPILINKPIFFGLDPIYGLVVFSSLSIGTKVLIKYINSRSS